MKKNLELLKSIRIPMPKPKQIHRDRRQKRSNHDKFWKNEVKKYVILT